jgi:hypothetical protein
MEAVRFKPGGAGSVGIHSTSSLAGRGYLPAEIFGHQPGGLQSSAAAVSWGGLIFAGALLSFHGARGLAPSRESPGNGPRRRRSTRRTMRFCEALIATGKP